MRLSTGTKLVATLAVSLILYGCAGEPVYRPFRILSDLTVSFADPAWDGKNIPAGQQCPDFGGQGGQGRIGYRFAPGTETLTLPSVPGNTFDLPEPFFVIAAHRKPFQSKPGAYLPPCSGGRGDLYYLLVKAIWIPESPEMEAEVLGQGKLFLGRY